MMKAKDVMKAIGLLGLGYVVGNAKGILDCGNAINKKLRPDHGLQVNDIWWKPLGCKITKLEIKEFKEGQLNKLALCLFRKEKICT